MKTAKRPTLKRVPTTLLSMDEAKEILGMGYSTLNRFLAQDVFSICRHSPGKRAPKHLYADELDVYLQFNAKYGPTEAMAEVRSFRRSRFRMKRR